MKYVLTYGVACIAEEDVSELILEISNITTDRDIAEALVKKCNDSRLSPVHLQDVVDDLINA